MKIYTIFWLTGETQLVKGDKPHEAMNNAGIGAGALRAMDFYAEGDKRSEYEWEKNKRKWKKVEEQPSNQWKLKGHSYQIADTGDYDGHYEITNGKISLLTKDDDNEALQPIVDALNNSGCKLYQDDLFEFENKMLKEKISRSYTPQEVRELFIKLETERAQYYKEDANSIVPLEKWLLAAGIVL